MRRFSFLISRYVLQAILPYFAITWLLLSVILFVQQASRFSDLLFNTSLPSTLLWQLMIALVPTVISFTCPIAALVGVIIGLSRMQGDSEMTAIRAAGIGNLQITAPVVLLGIVLSLFAIFINLQGVPFAAQIVRQVGLQAALYKLESPIEPGVFNSEIHGLTIYVKDGNLEKGTWENIFIYQEDKEGGETRLITAKEGRIDTKDEDSEIVLARANVTTIEAGADEKVVSESVKDLRLVVQTKRGELIDKLTQTKTTPEEMGLGELGRYAQTLEGIKQIEARILWQRRVLLSVTPLLFALLGAALVTKFNRGGRGFGIFLALVSLVIYYLLALLGEQLARTNTISVITSGLIPFLAIVAVTGWLFLSQRLFITRSFSIGSFFEREESSGSKPKLSSKNSYIDLTTGILDFDLVLNLIRNYLLTVGFLVAIYFIFTAFERWKFAGAMENGIAILGSYLFFLIPFIYIEIAPSALMVAALATYIIKSRQNEIVTWTAAGQSAYRLMLPCFILMIAIGAMNFGIQEWILTEANRTQDALLDRLKSRNKSEGSKGQYWVASGNNIYSFQPADASDNDSEIIKNLSIFEITPSNQTLSSLIKVDKARWNQNGIEFLEKPLILTKTGSKTSVSKRVFEFKGEDFNPFAQTVVKPSHLGIAETEEKIRNSNSESEQLTYKISLQKKYTTPFLPLVIILFTVPFALSLSRKGNVITLGYAVAIWLLYMGVTSIFGQFGASGYLSPFLAVWSPLVLFTILGLFLITRVKT